MPAAALLAFAALAASGCPAGRPAPPAPPTALTEADAGRAVTVPAGGLLEVALPATAGTGYLWEVAQGAPAVLAQRGDPAWEQQGPGRVGAQGLSRFTFEARRAGSAHLVLVYHRPWERDVAPLRTFAVDVTVR